MFVLKTYILLKKYWNHFEWHISYEILDKYFARRLSIIGPGTDYNEIHSEPRSYSPFSHQPTSKHEFNRRIVSRNSPSSYLIPYTYPVFGSYARTYIMFVTITIIIIITFAGLATQLCKNWKHTSGNIII